MRLIPRLLLSLLALLPLALSAAPAATDLQEGRDYERIAQPGPFQPLDGKIEVVEVFGYTCSHCAHFEPQLVAWVAKLPKDVRFTPVPAAFGGPWDAWATAYYAADQLGVAKRSHGAVFKALHEDRSLPMQNVSADELATFYKQYGVNEAAYVAALKSEAVQAKVSAARDFARRTRIPGTPSLVINGQFLVKGNSAEEQLRIASALIAQARSGKAR
ncbi:dihydroneopterin aldolase [Stenotrophomonas chelatiphaga]|jgi:protein dithiol oxidoreductase (disulfide-forming)|uniref:Thiol:disulfide interchange protein n=1 Tax=Stenotrophomonas chelatiphaga TaxID=517011 RepID=A0A0R0CWH2_9GAMM|nr:thiol:disulfide interchange protein DsbA/DsbL [Stenotrophomonas chelatiphaga]KRG73685.1 dihydroneopterin aldolase [Stenotrophomonas chelatiphaga]MCS4230026.1 thiol:disulfide interchange protein DsbA [Stenotrophomonas chelatiphaga]ROQ45751.1 thiol:disulfide interchange protein DsbA [Stenotrophomonas maltophilia]